jgi:CheY-like chemotaxis protein
MPEEDGLAVCAAVRSSPGLREIPLVLLTALPANDERVVRASTATNAVILIKTDISRLGELADQLVGSCGDEAA